MANYPVGVTLTNTAVIVEVTDDAIINTPAGAGLAAGYIRQLGILAYWTLDDYVQYDTTGSYLFVQAGITFAYVDASKLLFVQDPLPLP